MVNDGAFEPLVLYEAARGNAVDNKILAEILGISEKEAWEHTTRAAKLLQERGFIVPITKEKGKRKAENEEESYGEEARKATPRKKRATELVQEGNVKKMPTSGEAVLSMDDDEDSGVGTHQGKNRASPRKKRVAELQDEKNIKKLLASGEAVLVDDEDEDEDESSGWDFD